MATCDPSNIPLGWQCHIDPLPSLPVRIVLIFFDFAILLTVFLLYHYSTVTTRQNTKMFVFNTKNLSESEFIFSGIKIGFLGLVLAVINNIISHGSTIVLDRNAYFLVGFNSFLIILGVLFILFGFFIYYQFYIRSVVNLPENLSRNLTIVFLSQFLIFSISLIYILLDIYVATAFVTIQIFPIVILVLITIYVIFVRTSFENKLFEIRTKLLAFGYTLFALLFLWGLSFIPRGEYIPTRHDELELMIVGFNLFFLLFGIILYLIPAMPYWFRRYVGIEEDEFHEYTYNLYGVDPPNVIRIDAKSPHIDHADLPTMDSLNQGFLLFHNFSDMEIARHLFLNILQSKTKIIQTFDTYKTKEKFYNQQLAQNSNMIFLADEIDEGLDNLVDEIYNTHNWDINYYQGTIELNDYPFNVKNTEVALIFSGRSFWNPVHRIYFFLFNNTVNGPMLHFLDTYFDFLEDLTFETSPYLLILFFDKTDDGTLKNIPPDENDPSHPDGDHFRLFD